MWWNAFKYLLIGAVFWTVGAFLMIGDLAFYARSEPAALIVVRLDSKLERSTNNRHRFGAQHTRLYRPVFALDTSARPRHEYAGNTWVHPAPHQAGAHIEGRYDAASGEMQSNKMTQTTLWLSLFVQIIGLGAIIQGILMCFGMPELALPLRAGFGN